MSEPIADDGTRAAVLEALTAKAKAKEAPRTAVKTGEVDEQTPFSELLERSLEKRCEVNEDEVKASDEQRRQAISESQVDLVGDIMKRLL